MGVATTVRKGSGGIEDEYASQDSRRTLKEP
jgi:hypothetical protein